MTTFDGALRRYATPATTVVSVVVAVTGIILFFHLAKEPAETIHEWLGMTFAAVAALHVIRHRGSFVQVLKQSHTRLMAAAMAIGVIAFVLLAPSKPPGNPMIRLALAAQQAPISQLAPVIGNSPEQVLARLERAGIHALPHDTLVGLASTHQMDPVKVIGLALPPQQVR